ncbi:pyruvate:ferredoxin (flavodoxin) oxidoreductase [Flavitalea sp. BT771]|uniref:pyruvate:ferredoxin (flavodoxin) oxidoreductase n=1 Tax=Flavitalea sp. BT771 TaxID=3063329 RepID=UPI0026E492DC|nr:pyruvate:ferredoxin (flavodoxin) oxidoreductase [Flavitalea sp. BT771]MDO6435670.1 pyruvate:ferredoxin (flavodoxin) oxidoreductase [Flavitalea sp. BT771]MDV6224571.1 pyruvate:ferredoxin (flavodoxin) oxidoreductase [Flavitalea sp. BT771]
MNISSAPHSSQQTEKKKSQLAIMDGNEAAAYIAYKTNEVCAIYPITPSSTMGEWADEWNAKGIKNIFGQVPKVIEMQSEAGAAGAVHGALLGGSLSTTFTASQGLLLMIPNMYKIAGELLPAVFHIAARTLATHALSIFGDHSDVMAVRSTGFSMLFGNSSQEVMDMALIAQSATLSTRIPFLNIFDGFRTSHELTEVDVIPDDVIRAMIDMNKVNEHRARALSPDNPAIHGTAQNPDVFFQNREAANKYHAAVAATVKEKLQQFYELTGRKYGLFEYEGHKEADRLIIIMGSGAGAVKETVRYLNQQGSKVGVLIVRLFRPFSIADFLDATPATVRRIAVLDRCKEPNSIGEPLFMDVVNAFNDSKFDFRPVITGGRYGLSSKEFTPAMVTAIFEELDNPNPRRHFTIGIEDDVSRLSLAYQRSFSLDKQHLFRGLFFGLGADGTVSANKNSIKIIGTKTDNYIQGYFVYDSKKSGSLTVSHLRFGKQPIQSTYLIDSANFIACHHFNYLTKYDILKDAEPGAVFLLNAPYPEHELWEKLPRRIQQEIVEKQLKFYAINAHAVAKEAGMGTRINTILQTCFFAISNILPRDEAISKIKEAIYETYWKKGEEVVKKNYEAVDKTLMNLFEVNYSHYAIGDTPLDNALPASAPQFVREVLGKIIAGNGEELPVSAFPGDGTFPSGTTKWEKRNIADAVPVWDTSLCTQCNKCVLICPHAAIRAKVYDKSLLDQAPSTFKYMDPIGKEWDKTKEAYTLQVSTEDCTGCNLCMEFCPITSKTTPGHKAVNLYDKSDIQAAEKENWEFFLHIPEVGRERVNRNTVKGSQFFQPLFEFSGACSGCGETPYLKLLTQLYGERMIVANATGCSSIFGGNLPTTPWSKNNEGRGPAWANSLFEDNAEFGLGIKLANDKKKESAISLLDQLRLDVGEDLADAIIHAPETTEAEIKAKQGLIKELRHRLSEMNSLASKDLFHLADFLSEKTLWIIGGDGWAYDIGFGGLDHVLSTGENVNILVMDTEVYSNTGGQKSKSTPIGASAKFSVNGKTSGKKDLALQAIAHGTAYVAQIAMGANDTHTLRTIIEAEAFPGPSLIIAYAHCIAHGIEMDHGTEDQDLAVKTGYWPLFHYNPLKPKGQRFVIDSKEPSLPLSDFMYRENRFSVIRAKDPTAAATFLTQAEEAAKEKWERLKMLTAL